MTDTKQQGFKTLLEEEREKKTSSPSRFSPEFRWWKKEGDYYRSCPHMEDSICVLSKKFRKAGIFSCSGSWHQTCQVYLLVANNNDDPTVLSHE